MKQIVSKELFGARFSEVLAASSENSYTLAAKLSLTPGTISRYANGLMAPKVPTLYMMADIFRVSPLWLMGYDAAKYDLPAPVPLPYSSAPGPLRLSDVTAAPSKPLRPTELRILGKLSALTEEQLGRVEGRIDVYLEETL